jgi:hypothetical protein
MFVDDAQTTFVKFVDDQSTRKSMKSISIMIVQKIIVMSNTKHFNKILLNENAKINVINYRYAIAHDMTSIDNDFSISSHVKKKIDALLRRIQCAHSTRRQLKAEACFRDDVLCLEQEWNVKYDSRIVRIKINWDEVELSNVYLTLWFFKANFENIIKKRFREEN